MERETLFPLQLQFFAADGGSGGPNTGGAGTGGQEPDAGGKDGGATKVQFTPEQQAAIDAIIAERLSRAEKSAAKKALEARAKELGFESAEAMEAALKAAKEAQDAQKSEAEKLREALEAEKAKAAQAVERAKTALIKAAFTAEALAANLVSVDDAFKLADLSGVEVDDDGTVTGVKEAVEKLVQEKPYLVKQAVSGGAGGGNPARSRTGDSNPADAARAIMQRQGLLRPETVQPQAPKSSFFGS